MFDTQPRFLVAVVAAMILLPGVATTPGSAGPTTAGVTEERHTQPGPNEDPTATAGNQTHVQYGTQRISTGPEGPSAATLRSAIRSGAGDDIDDIVSWGYRLDVAVSDIPETVSSNETEAAVRNEIERALQRNVTVRILPPEGNTGDRARTITYNGDSIEQSQDPPSEKRTILVIVHRDAPAPIPDTLTDVRPG